MKNFFERAALTSVALVLSAAAAQADPDDLVVTGQQQHSSDSTATLSGFARVTKNPLTDGGTKFFQLLTNSQKHSTNGDDEAAKRAPKGVIGVLSKLDALNCLGINPGWRQPFGSKSQTSKASVDYSSDIMTVPNARIESETKSAPLTYTRESTTTSVVRDQNSVDSTLLLRPEMR